MAEEEPYDGEGARGYMEWRLKRTLNAIFFTFVYYVQPHVARTVAVFFFFFQLVFIG